jgi:outer membrane receptor protein involved in Fe transport
MKNPTTKLLTAAVSCLLMYTNVIAAEIEEIVVTATKRGEVDVQSLGAAIYAITGDNLENRNQIDFEEFAASVPGLHFQDLGPGDKEYIIRGINGNGPAVVGAYFDEYVITANDQQDGGGKNAPIKLVDMERIEVLNGPQGTLYGANSMAGNIKFIPRKPNTEEFSVSFNSDFSDTTDGGTGYNLSGALNLPASDQFAVRLVGWRTDADGWIDQPRLQTGPTTFDGAASDINDEETNGARVMFSWLPTDRLTIDALYLFQDTEIGGSSRFTAKGVPTWPDQPPEIASIPGNGGFTPLPGLPSLTPSDDFQNSDITVNTRDDDADLFGLTAQLDFDVGTATVSASSYEHDINFVFDSTPILLFFGVDAPGVTVQPQSYENTMFEARFASTLDGPVNFVAGAYYQKDENDFEVQVVTTDGAGNPVPFDPLDSNDFFGGGTVFFGRFRDDEIEQKALFGEVSIDFADAWTLVGGLRWFDVEIQSIQATLHNFGGGVRPPPNGTIIGTTVNGNPVGLVEVGDDAVRGKISLSYQVNDDVMLYGLFSQGFRVGGVNNNNQPFTAGIPATFDSDDLNNIEFGIKSRWHDSRLQANATLFFIDWDDIQVEPRDPAGNIPFTANGGAADISGLEWAIIGLPGDNWEFTFSGTLFFDHELSEDQPPLQDASQFVIVGQTGDELPNVPELQLYASAQYNGEISGKPFSVVADVAYRDEANTEFRANNPFNIKLDSYAIANLHANFDITDNVSIGAYVKNLTDELAVYDGIGTFQDPESIVANRPRTIGATLRLRF